MKKAVVYYSLSGNTKEAAEKIAKEIGADLIHIDQMKAMPESKATQMFVGGMKATFGMKPQIKGVLRILRNMMKSLLELQYGRINRHLL